MLTLFQWIGLVWFATSMIAFFVIHIAFLVWLRAQGVKYSLFYCNVPGYVDVAYRQWCRSRGAPPRAWLLVHLCFLANAGLASVGFFFLVIMAFSSPL